MHDEEERRGEGIFYALQKYFNTPLKCDAQFLAEAVIIASKIYRSPDRQKDSFM